MRSFLAFAALCFLAVASPVLAAETFIPGSACATLGATHMSADHSSLVFCGLVTPNGAETCSFNADGCKWKSMSSSGGSCYTDYSLLPGTPAGSVCMVSGFTVKGSVGWWGVSYGDYHLGGGVGSWSPPGGPLPANWVSGADSWSGAKEAEAFLCCQN